MISGAIKKKESTIYCLQELLLKLIVYRIIYLYQPKNFLPETLSAYIYFIFGHIQSSSFVFIKLIKKQLLPSYSEFSPWIKYLLSMLFKIVFCQFYIQFFWYWICYIPSTLELSLCIKSVSLQLYQSFFHFRNCLVQNN